MKRHVSASAAGTSAGSEGGAVASIAGRARAAGKDEIDNQPAIAPAPGERTLSLASVRAWTHTLVLTGELNHRSAHVLEAAIERLCEEGVTGVTLDLRRLQAIDATGVAVIAFRSALCKRRGYDLAIIAGAPAVHREFERAGAVAELPFCDDDVRVPAEDVLGPEWGTLAGDRSAAVVKNGATIVAASRLDPAAASANRRGRTDTR